MKSFKLPRDQWEPAWGGLFGAVPVAWIFWGPYHAQAEVLEWVVTSIAYAIFLVLYTLYVIYWSRKRVILSVCIGMLALAIIFTAYRPSGITFYLFVAALNPFVVDGRFAQSAAIVLGVILVLALEWLLSIIGKLQHMVYKNDL